MARSSITACFLPVPCAVSSDKSIDVRLGNSNGATIEVDGKAQDLTPFRHANVAHFKLSDGDAAISHSGT